MLKKLPGFMLCLLAFFLIFQPTGYSASLPKATQEMLKKLRLEPSILADVDKNLKVPQEWIEKAKKEGKLKVRGSPATRKELTILHGPFKERYPFIDIDYYGSNRQGRTIKTLIERRYCLMTLKKIPPGVPYPSPINELMPRYLIKLS